MLTFLLGLLASEPPSPPHFQNHPKPLQVDKDLFFLLVCIYEKLLLPYFGLLCEGQDNQPLQSVLVPEKVLRLQRSSLQLELQLIMDRQEVLLLLVTVLHFSVSKDRN